MSIKPRVSVCITTYNHERYIKECLASVIAQQFDVDLEILVGDDESADQTFDVVQRISNTIPGVIQLFRHAKNVGPTANLQFLIAKASGEYVAHLDGDDYWMPSKLSVQVDFLLRHPECAAVYSNAALIDQENGILGAFNRRMPETFDINYLLEKGNFLNHSSLVYRSQYRSRILEMEPPFIDYQIHMALAGLGKLGYVNQMLTAYRINSASSILASSRDLIIKYKEDAVLKALSSGIVSRKTARLVAFDWFVHAWKFIIKHGEIRKGIDEMKRVWRLVPGSAIPLAIAAMPYVFIEFGKKFFGTIRKKVCGAGPYVYRPR